MSAPAGWATPGATPGGTPGATALPSGVERERLIEDAPAQLDQFGRVPLARLTFAPGAELPAGYLVGPLVAVVEAGAFEVQVGAAQSPSTVAAGGRVDVADAAAVAARNTAAVEGSWLVLVLRRDISWFEADFWGLPEQAAAPGVALRLLFTDQSPVDRLFPVRTAVDRLVLAPGAALPSVDLGGPTPALFVALRVEAGAVSPAGPVGAEAGGADVLRAGDYATFDVASVISGEAAGVHSVGEGPAVLLLARVAEDPDPPEQQG
jgi:hypothetical protein